MKTRNLNKNLRWRRAAGVALVLAGTLSAFNGNASRLSFAGADLTTGGAWRTRTVVKLLDADHDNIYGTDGYVVVTSPGGDLARNPAYASATRLATYTFYSGDQTTPQYVAIDNPAGGSMFTGIWMSTGTADLEEQPLAQITITAAASFRLGVLVDQADYPDLSPKSLRLRQTQGGTVDTGLVDSYSEPNLDGDWYFFDIREAQPGDTFVLSGTNLRAGGPFQDGNGIGGLTFDSITLRAALELQLYAGLMISGDVGTVHSIEYATDLAQSNNASAWRCLEYLQLATSPCLWLDKSAPATANRFYRAVVFRAPTNMVFIPAGTFLMGSPTNELGRDSTEGPQTTVTISRGFWMGKYELTQAEYLAVMGNNPSSHKGDLQLPVEFTSWRDATNYCARVTERERTAGRIAANSFYRLPTEAEWEYACRARTSTRFTYGEDPGYTVLGVYAWYKGNSGDTTHPVGQKLPNAFGLYDMHGNVWELCLDTWGYPIGNHPGGCVTDPQSIGPSWGNALIRGGCSTADGQYNRSAWRTLNSTTSCSWMGGFRVVLVPGQP